MAQNYTLTNLHEFFDGDIIQRMIEMSIHIDRILKLAELDFDLLKLNFIIIILVKKPFILKVTNFTTLKTSKLNLYLYYHTRYYTQYSSLV